MTIMVVASPCALIISTPATVLSAIGGAARRGILIKGGSHLERAAHIDIVAIDKTGTLTVGKPSLTGIVTTGGVHPLSGKLPGDAIDLLRTAAALEAKSEHPLAHAIVKSARDLGIDPPEATDFNPPPEKAPRPPLGKPATSSAASGCSANSTRQDLIAWANFPLRCRPWAKPAFGSACARATMSPRRPCW